MGHVTDFPKPPRARNVMNARSLTAHRRVIPPQAGFAQQPFVPPKAPKAAAESYQAGGTAATLAAVDLQSEAEARDRLVQPAPPAFGQPRFVPQRMEIPTAMSLTEFVAKHYPGLTAGKAQPYGTNASVMRSYNAHLQETSRTRKDAQVNNNRMGMQRETLDLKRAEFNAKQAAGRVDKDKFATFEALVMDRIHDKPVSEWHDDQAFQMWAKMKSVAGDELLSLKEQIADQTVRATKEAREQDGKPGIEADILVLMTNPLEALKLMKAAENPKTMKRLEAEALAGAIRGQTPDQQLKTIRSGGKGGGGLLTGTKFGNEVFGEMGGFGGITKQLNEGGIEGFVEVLERFQSMVPTMNDEQREALSQIIRNKAPTPEEIINNGPKFKGRDGKTRGNGLLTEEQVEAALRFVITPEQRRQLGP